MKSNCEWLDQIKDPFDQDVVYSLNLAKQKFQWTDLCKDGWLILNWDAEKCWLKFAVLTFSWSDDKDIGCECLFHGCGPSSVLRECRHTYWGEDGYLFYPNGAVIIAAFKALSEYFDGMDQPKLNRSNER